MLLRRFHQFPRARRSASDKSRSRLPPRLVQFALICSLRTSFPRRRICVMYDFNSRSPRVDDLVLLFDAERERRGFHR